MMMAVSRCFPRLGLALLTAAGVAGAAQAHDPSGRGGAPMAPQKEFREIRSGLAQLGQPDRAMGVYSRLMKWPPRFSVLRVCFMGGKASTNRAVAKIAGEWTARQNLGLTLDFGPAKNPRRCDAARPVAEIRVSYSGIGYWSYLGQESLKVDWKLPSLNLEGYDKAKASVLSERELRATILHEFGHALGLDHEHQSPASVCATEFNWPYLYSYLGGPPANWDKETIDYNLGPLVANDLSATEFDPKSVMIYSLPKEYFLKGRKSPCFVANSNARISRLDKAILASMYPAQLASRVEEFGRTKAEFLDLLNSANDAGFAQGLRASGELFTSEKPAGQ